MKIEGASPPSRLDHAMTTITFPFSPPPESNDIDNVIITSSLMSQQAQPLTGSAPSQFITVMGPETADDLLAFEEKQCAPPNMTCASKDDIITKMCSEAHKEDDSLDSQKGDNPGNLKRDTLETAEVQDSEESLQKQCDSEVVMMGLIIFGGIDTSGHIHNDCFVFAPGT